MRPCPNCYVMTEDSNALCPNCGAELKPRGPLLTHSVTLDLVLGIVTGLIFLFLLPGVTGRFLFSRANSIFPFLLLHLSTYVIPAILYFVLRKRYPSFMRGLGFVLLICLSLELGVLLLCVGMIYGLSGMR